MTREGAITFVTSSSRPIKVRLRSFTCGGVVREYISTRKSRYLSLMFEFEFCLSFARIDSNLLPTDHMIHSYGDFD